MKDTVNYDFKGLTFERLLDEENEKTLTLKGGETDVKSIRSDCRQAGTDG